MSIIKYKAVNPVVNVKLPFYNSKNGIFYIPINHTYKYYIEAIVPQTGGGVKYYILLGKTKFDNNCRICHTDAYGRVQVRIKGSFKEFVLDELKERANLNVEYIESADDYDAYHIY